MRITITLNTESAAVLLRCLSRGQHAISADEVKNGVENVIISNVDLIRHQICRLWAEQIISDAVKAVVPKKN